MSLLLKNSIVAFKLFPAPEKLLSKKFGLSFSFV